MNYHPSLCSVVPPVTPQGPIDTLEDALLCSHASLSQATYRFLKLLAQFDLRRGWLRYGCNDCAEYLDLKLGMARATALEKLRVARALTSLPRIDAAMNEGVVSYSQVRALTRVADEDNEARLLRKAEHLCAGELEDYCRRLKHGDASASKQDAAEQFHARELRIVVQDGVLRAQLPPDQLAVLQQAIEMMVDTLSEDADRSFHAARADALVAMARRVVEASSAEDPEASSSAENGQRAPSPPQVLVHVDATALAGAGGEADYPLPTMQRLCCDGEVTAIYKEGDAVLNVGRKHRIVPPRLKKALVARDRHCRFPGCHHTRFLDAHHIQHWCDGGQTTLDNLVLLCTHHHAALHERGFQLQRGRDGALRFSRADGRAVGARS